MTANSVQCSVCWIRVLCRTTKRTWRFLDNACLKNRYCYSGQSNPRDGLQWFFPNVLSWGWGWGGGYSALTSLKTSVVNHICLQIVNVFGLQSIHSFSGRQNPCILFEILYKIIVLCNLCPEARVHANVKFAILRIALLHCQPFLLHFFLHNKQCIATSQAMTWVILHCAAEIHIITDIL